MIPPWVVVEVGQVVLTIPGGAVGRQFSAKYAVGVVSPSRVGVGLRPCAGLIEKLVLCGLFVTASMFRPCGQGVGAVHPDSISALFRTQNCAPIYEDAENVGSTTKSLAAISNLSVL